MNNELPELVPRNQCEKYMGDNNIRNPVLMVKQEFDNYVKSKSFRDGPHRDTFGDGYGHPYNPHRQAFGILKKGIGIFCELGESSLDPELAKRLTSRVKEKISEFNQTQKPKSDDGGSLG